MESLSELMSTRSLSLLGLGFLSASAVVLAPAPPAHALVTLIDTIGPGPNGGYSGFSGGTQFQSFTTQPNGFIVTDVTAVVGSATFSGASQTFQLGIYSADNTSARLFDLGSETLTFGPGIEYQQITQSGLNIKLSPSTQYFFGIGSAPGNTGVTGFASVFCRLGNPNCNLAPSPPGFYRALKIDAVPAPLPAAALAPLALTISRMRRRYSR